MTDTLVSFLLCGVGIALLYYGATMLIGNATRLAKNIGVPLIVIGFTIVALGTSLPELIVGIIAGVAGENEIVLGNILGSNMANLGLALGLAALISPIGMPTKDNRFELYCMVLTVAFLYMLLRDGNLDRIDGMTLVIMGLAFTVVVIVRAARSNQMGQIVEKIITVQHRRNRAYDIIGIAAGMTLMLVGARMALTNGISLARALGVSEVLIGITLIAVGTSLPEITTTVISSLRKSSDLIAGNIIGSNILNVLIVLGLTVMITPITVRQTVWMYDLPVLMLVSTVIVTLMRTGRALSRREGLFLVGSYAVYILFAAILRV